MSNKYVVVSIPKYWKYCSAIKQFDPLINCQKSMYIKKSKSGQGFANHLKLWLNTMCKYTCYNYFMSSQGTYCVQSEPFTAYDNINLVVLRLGIKDQAAKQTHKSGRLRLFSWDCYVLIGELGISWMAPAVFFWKSLSRILNINLTHLEFVKGPPDPPTPQKNTLNNCSWQELHPFQKRISNPMHEKEKCYLSMSHETLNMTEERGSNCQHLTLKFQSENFCFIFSQDDTQPNRSSSQQPTQETQNYY